MAMFRFLGAVALLGAVGAAKQEKENLFFPANWKPSGVAASVVGVEKSQTTYSLGCQPKATDDCSLYLKTMTQGPSTWVWGGEWENIAGVDQYTLNNACKVDRDEGEMTCTMEVTQVKNDKTLSTATTGTTSDLSDYIYPIPITVDKGSADHPKPTQTEATSETTGGSKSKDNSSQTSDPVFVAAIPTKDAITELSTTPTPPASSSATTSAVVTPSNTDNAAGPLPTHNAMLLGAAAVMGGALIL